MAPFLAFDGLDGTGKTTQVHLLAERLRSHGHQVTTCSDPGGTELGSRLREILLFGRQHSMSLRTEALLFMASRAELVDRVIRPALEQGHIVLSDRYLLANVVYQGYAGGLDPVQLWSAGALSTAGIEPSLTLILDLPCAAARARLARPTDRMESRGSDYFERVRQGFLTEAARLGHESARVLDSSSSIEKVHELVWAEVIAWLSRMPQ